MILVTGGSGLVGKHLKDIMSEALYITSTDFDLTNEIDVNVMLDLYKPKTVIHLAARVGGIIDNINKPSDYFSDNILRVFVLPSPLWSLVASHNFPLKTISPAVYVPSLSNDPLNLLGTPEASGTPTASH